MTIAMAIASDHAGFPAKEMLVAHLRAKGITVEDLGTKDTTSCDYPDYAKKLSEWVLAGKDRKGILVCGSGTGMSMAANRFAGIRAALCRSGLEAKLARAHNDANVLCLGARISGEEVVKDCVDAFLATAFEGGRHQTRIEKMT